MITMMFILGFTLLLFGRKLLWLCVGGIGFAAGMALASHLFHAHSESVRVIIALGSGLAGAILAFFLQRIAVGFAGFIAGAYAAYALVVQFHQGSEQSVWLWVLVGGILGSIILLMAFDWTIVILSSLTGAAFILQAMHPREVLEIPLFILFALGGIAIQSGLLRKRSPQPGHAASKG
jgi:hypothetical protein